MNDPLDNLRRLATVLGWCALAVVLFSTLSPIELRPHIPDAGADLERFLAYFAVGGMLAFAYPRQRGLVLAGTIVLALGLEWGQTSEATRHGRLHDVFVKILGTLTGGAAAFCLDYLAQRLRNVT